MIGADFSLAEFMSKVDNLGSIAKRNKFSIEITPPITMDTDIPAQTVNFLAKTVSFPGRAFGTTTFRSGGQFALDVPYEITQEPVSITFLGTNDWSTRKFWYDWIEHIQSVKNYNMEY